MSRKSSVNTTPKRPEGDEAIASSAPAVLSSIQAFGKKLRGGFSLSRAQAIIGTLAGVISIGGAVIPLVQTAHPTNSGDLVAIVQAAGSRGSVTDATVEVLTPQNALVATLTPDASGRVTQELKEGVYVVRVSHPKYAADVRRVQVLPRQTVEVRANLKAGSSAPTKLERAVDSGVNAILRAFR